MLASACFGSKIFLDKFQIPEKYQQAQEPSETLLLELEIPEKIRPDQIFGIVVTARRTGMTNIKWENSYSLSFSEPSLSFKAQQVEETAGDPLKNGEISLQLPPGFTLLEENPKISASGQRAYRAQAPSAPCQRDIKCVFFDSSNKQWYELSRTIKIESLWSYYWSNIRSYLISFLVKNEPKNILPPSRMVVAELSDMVISYTVPSQIVVNSDFIMQICLKNGGGRIAASGMKFDFGDLVLLGERGFNNVDPSFVVRAAKDPGNYRVLVEANSEILAIPLVIKSNLQ